MKTGPRVIGVCVCVAGERCLFECPCINMASSTTWPPYCFAPIFFPARMTSSTSSNLIAMSDPKCSSCFLTR